MGRCDATGKNIPYLMEINRMTSSCFQLFRRVGSLADVEVVISLYAYRIGEEWRVCIDGSTAVNLWTHAQSMYGNYSTVLHVHCSHN